MDDMDYLFYRAFGEIEESHEIEEDSLKRKEKKPRKIFIPNDLAHLKPVVKEYEKEPDEWRDDDPLPKVNVVVITWTGDEADGLAAVLSPGMPRKKWYSYSRDFHRIWPELQAHRLIQWKEHKSQGAPTMYNYRYKSRQNGIFGTFISIRIGDLDVLLFHSQLHLNTDGREIPLKFLIERIIEDCNPDLILSVGTSGGVDPEDHLGDAIVSNSALFILGEEFADASFNRMKYISQWIPRDTYKNIVETPQNMPLIPEPSFKVPAPQYIKSMGEKINPSLNPEQKSSVMKITERPILTTDFFHYGTTKNRLDKYGSAVEMGDAFVARVCHKNNIPFGFVRNVSDPVINGKLDEDLQGTFASNVYYTAGVDTSMNGAIATWALIAAEADDPLGLKNLKNTPSVEEGPLNIPTPTSGRKQPESKPFNEIKWEANEPEFKRVDFPQPPKHFDSILNDKNEYMPLSKADIVIFSWNSNTREALDYVFFRNINDRGKTNWKLYLRGFDEISRQRKIQRVAQQDGYNDFAILPHKKDFNATGQYRVLNAGDKKILLFDTRASILHDGSVKILDSVISRVLKETKPELVLCVGTGQATDSSIDPGSVVIANKAMFLLSRKDFVGYEHNLETFGSEWMPNNRFFSNAISKMIKPAWPAMLPPSEAFREPMKKLKEPKLKDPEIFVDMDYKIITAPRSTPLNPFYYVPFYHTASTDKKFNEIGTIIELCDAVVAKNCQEQNMKCGFINAVTVPLLVKAEEADRRAWAAYFQKIFERDAILNAALTTWAVISSEVQ